MEKPITWHLISIVNAVFLELLKQFFSVKHYLCRKTDSTHKESEENISEIYYKHRFEFLYHNVENFVRENYTYLSDVNKQYSARFLEAFSQTYVSGATYAQLILSGDIKLGGGDRENELKVAARVLATSVYSSSNMPLQDFSVYNKYYLATMFKNGWIHGFGPDEGKRKAAIIMQPIRCELDYWRSIKDKYKELGVSMSDLLNNELYPYCLKLMQESEFYKYKQMDDCIKDENFLGRVITTATRDIITSVIPSQELIQKSIFDAALKYFSNTNNYPLL